MSYLSGPRLVFSGQFQANVSTVNNDPEHFDSRTFQPNYQERGAGATNGWWNPDGSAAWRFQGCVVQRVVYRDGTTCDDPSQDPVVGTMISDDESGVPAKLVDLDSEQQMVSQIWGLKVLLGKPGSGFGFTSDYAVAAFNDIFVRFPGGQPDSFFGAAYQSVLQAVRWEGSGASRFLQELSADGIPETLSIKFNVDGFNDDSTTAGFTFGRIVGSIGPYVDGDPRHFVAGRALQSVEGSPLNTAYAEVVNSTLTIDLGNSLTTQSPGGPPAELGTLQVAILEPGGPAIPVGTIPYTDPDWYTKTAGIVSFSLSPAQLRQASNAPLALIQTGAGAPALLLTEAQDGVWLRADSFVFRLNPYEQGTTTFYMAAFGKRAPGQTISLNYDASIMQGQTKQGPIPGPSVVGEPQSALTFPTSLTTGDDGTAELTLNARDPGTPRNYIDGQVYGVTYGPGNVAPAVGAVTNSSQILSVLVWSGFTAPAQPTWVHDVQPILQQYANLYPVMKPLVNLASYDDVVAKRLLLKQVFGVPRSNPFYMPVTRDLSAAKQAMILKWLDNPIRSAHDVL